jgi:hypothetical protein
MSRMLRSSLLIAVSLVAFACSKDKAKDTTSTTPPAGSAAAGSGSAMAGSGSDTGSATGSGSAMAGSGSDAGSAAGSAGSGSAAAGSGSSAHAEPESEFDKLSHDDKVKFMKTKVMPAMKAAFQKFDPKEFANFTCKTCHGKDPAKNKYEMPTKDLPPLDFAKLEAGKEEPKTVEFMSKVVKPQMAKILGMPEMTETQKGFGCLNCHTEKKS